MILLYSFSSLFCLICLFFRKIKINNPMPWMFYLFINLYTFATYFSHIFNLDFIISVNNKRVIDIFLFTSSLSLLTFSILLLCSSIYKKEYKIQFIKNKLNHFLVFIIIFPIALYINSLTSWTYDRAGILPSLAAYLRNIISILTLLILLTDNYSRKIKYFAVFLCAILTFVSTQRTNFFIIIIGILLTEKNNKTALLMMCATVFFVLAVGSVRNNISVLRILYPIIGEGVLGSWGMINAIEHYLENGYNIYNLIRPINPAISWLIPGLELKEMSSGIADYYPMGGFFFLSDAYLFNPILGPIIYTIIFHLIYSWSFTGMLKSKTKKIDFFLIQCLLFFYIKANIGTITAMLVFFFLVLYLYKAFISLLSIGTRDIRYYGNQKNQLKCSL